jgi:hypothetical protein
MCRLLLEYQTVTLAFYIVFAPFFWDGDNFLDYLLINE